MSSGPRLSLNQIVYSFSSFFFAQIFFFENTKPTKVSLFDSPYESLRKQLLVSLAERIFHAIYKRAEIHESFGFKGDKLGFLCSKEQGEANEEED